jgi:nicotinate dehydrogenase subunit A
LSIRTAPGRDGGRTSLGAGRFGGVVDTFAEAEEQSPPMAEEIVLEVNGRTRRLQADPDTPLLHVLRNDLGLTGAKFGCGLEQCGACAVIADGEAVLSCRAPVEAFRGRKITTIEGLGTPENLHPLQRAFIVEQAAQCGYCIPGIVMAAKALLDRNPQPTDSDIRQALARHLCRCGTHPRILKAVRRAVQEMAVRP